MFQKTVIPHLQIRLWRFLLPMGTSRSNCLDFRRDTGIWNQRCLQIGVYQGRTIMWNENTARHTVVRIMQQCIFNIHSHHCNTITIPTTSLLTKKLKKTKQNLKAREQSLKAQRFEQRRASMPCNVWPPVMSKSSRSLSVGCNPTTQATAEPAFFFDHLTHIWWMFSLVL